MSGTENLHEAGECRPCIFFHKDRGCVNADKCVFCHVCPQDAVAKRKKSRKEELKNLKRSNPGSKDHPEECRPCAFFHPKEGAERICTAGVDCEFCHLCAPGELTRRKKMQQKSRKAPRMTTTVDLMLTTHPKDSGMTFVPDVGLVQDDIWEKARRLTWAAGEDAVKSAQWMPKPKTNMTYVAGVGLVKDSSMDKSTLKRVTIMSDKSESENRCSTSDARLMVQTWDKDSDNPVAKFPKNAGSTNHPEDCKPCAFFHKDQGCTEAEECVFCHACPAGAARSSQKKKKKAMRLLKKMNVAVGSGPPGLPFPTERFTVPMARSDLNKIREDSASEDSVPTEKHKVREPPGLAGIPRTRKTDIPKSNLNVSQRKQSERQQKPNFTGLVNPTFANTILQ